MNATQKTDLVERLSGSLMQAYGQPLKYVLMVLVGVVLVGALIAFFSKVVR